MPDSHRAMCAFFGSVMEPWDGPAALAMCDGRWAVAGMDRNALRPMRYTLTDDDLLIVGSETGMVVVPEARVRKKGRLGPGQMIAVDLDEGKFYTDQSKTGLPTSIPMPIGSRISARLLICRAPASQKPRPWPAISCAACK
jgi:glutamine phosphoribosylpyrophosphate amidotransferase